MINLEKRNSQYYIRSDIDQIRSISISEAARLQTIPFYLLFESVIDRLGITITFKYFGNDVPPLKEECIALKMKLLKT